MNFEGFVYSCERKENEFTAKEFDGTAWIEFEKTKNFPSSIKIAAKCDKGGVIISIQTYRQRKTH
jgi:hypothetical protein